VALTNEGPFVVSDPCPHCDGQGTIREQPCAACRGTGVRRFYHGTKADLRPGDLIEPGFSSNFGKGK
jgi:DnaJ-class molecular chaperone